MRYKTRKWMVFTDTLSRSPNAKDNSLIELDMKINCIDDLVKDNRYKTIG